MAREIKKSGGKGRSKGKRPSSGWVKPDGTPLRPRKGDYFPDKEIDKRKPAQRSASRKKYSDTDKPVGRVSNRSVDTDKSKYTNRATRPETDAIKPEAESDFRKTTPSKDRYKNSEFRSEKGGGFEKGRPSKRFDRDDKKPNRYVDRAEGESGERKGYSRPEREEKKSSDGFEKNERPVKSSKTRSERDENKSIRYPPKPKQDGPEKLTFRDSEERPEREERKSSRYGEEVKNERGPYRKPEDIGDRDENRPSRYERKPSEGYRKPEGRFNRDDRKPSHFNDKSKSSNVDRDSGKKPEDKSRFDRFEKKPARFSKKPIGSDRSASSRSASGTKYNRDDRGGDREKPEYSKGPKKNTRDSERRPAFKGGDNDNSDNRLLTTDKPVRLNKFIANAGLCSRREADDFITAGVISINGEIVSELGIKVYPGDAVKFHDQTLKTEKMVYVLLNKPKDYITTTDDPEERRTVMNLVHNAGKERLFPVGRLDRNTTGLLLITNDGDLTKRLTHPSGNVKKIYQVELDRSLTQNDMLRAADGVELEDGPANVDEIHYESPDDKTIVGVELHSGRNRVVRRIFEAMDYKVKKLDRVYFAGLTKKDLPRGRWRFLTEMEVNMLKMLTGKKR